MEALRNQPLACRLGHKNDLLYLLTSASGQTRLAVYNADNLECVHEVGNLDAGFTDLFVRSPVYHEFFSKRLNALCRVSKQLLEDALPGTNKLAFGIRPKRLGKARTNPSVRENQERHQQLCAFGRHF